ncbi:MAG: Gx transporter family protein [Actinobacteria bacterium]|nr:MAG: Gx transporter family protein [Actinomycetota bacterium]
MRSTRVRASAASVLVRTALLAALAAAIGYAEAALLPALPVPGLRLGLANVAVLVALVSLGRRPALAVGAVKVLLVGLATGGLLGPSGAMSAAGTLAAWAVACLLDAAGERFSPVGLGVGASAAHVAAQFVVACVLTGSPAPLLLLSLSLAASLPAGLATGYSARLLVSRTPLTQVSVGV